MPRNLNKIVRLASGEICNNLNINNKREVSLDLYVQIIFTVNVIRKKLQKYCTVCKLGEKRIGIENYIIRKGMKLLAGKQRKE